MSAVISGTNGLLQSYDRQVLTTAFSYTFAAGTQVLIIEPAGTLATGTITMPASPADGMTITVESTQQVTALTMSGNGGTIVGPAVQLIPNQPLSWVYRLANTTWYPLWGGAGRASALVSGTSVASTSGTSIDFTSIPSWVKRITVMFETFGTSGSSLPIIKLGTSSGIVSTGYLSAGSYVSSSVGTSNSTTGFPIGGSINVGRRRNGSMVITKLSESLLVANCVYGLSDIAESGFGGGSVVLGSALTTVRLTTVNGTDTFVAGSINILFE